MYKIEKLAAISVDVPNDLFEVRLEVGEHFDMETETHE